MRRSAAVLAALACGVAVAMATPARACDVCAVYTATEVATTRTGVQIGVAEQLSRFSTRLPAADGSLADRGERLTSSTTQIFGGWTPDPRFSLQVNLPVITRAYRRLENGVRVGDRLQDGVLVRGSETGIGDLSLLGLWRPGAWVTERSVVRFTLLGGVKFPTGDGGRLREEAAARARARATADGLYGGREAHHVPEGSPSGINGHDLALGTGSYDGIVGGLAYASLDRFFITVGVQYALRTKGAFGYRYGNEVNWFTTLGGYLILDHDYTLALQLVSSGVHQAPDTLDGTETGGDDAESGARLWVFVGPGLSFTWGTSVAAEIAGDLPVQHDDLGLVPAYRIRGGLTYRF